MRLRRSLEIAGFTLFCAIAGGVIAIAMIETATGIVYGAQLVWNFLS
jgi:hypothetical protein